MSRQWIANCGQRRAQRDCVAHARDDRVRAAARDAVAARSVAVRVGVINRLPQAQASPGTFIRENIDCDYDRRRCVDGNKAKRESDDAK